MNFLPGKSNSQADVPQQFTSEVVRDALAYAGFEITSGTKDTTSVIDEITSHLNSGVHPYFYLGHYIVILQATPEGILFRSCQVH